MPTIVPDRGNDPKRVPGSYMSEVKKVPTPHSYLSKSATKTWLNEGPKPRRKKGDK